MGELFGRADYQGNEVAVDTVLQQTIDDFAYIVGSRLPQPVDDGRGDDVSP